MVFSSMEFLFRFLPLFLLIYFVTKPKYRNVVLLLGSLVFYAYGEPIYVFLMMFSIIFNYSVARRIKRFYDIEVYSEIDCSFERNCWLAVAMVFDFGMLFIFKYINFFIEIINTAAGTKIFDSVAITLPLGISFYTFQSISYLMDVYRREIQAERSFANFGAYLTMFPQLIAGPIVKYREIKEEMIRRKSSFAQFDEGLRIFTLGLGMKVLLANRIGSLWSDIQAVGFESISTPVAWMGIFAFSFQLYFDFYGYSMMAIGLGRIMGFTIPQNFDHPYQSLSMTEFWRRWHMTLGSWFREYVYIPLGGNRRSAPRVYFNLFVVWLLTGFWHGAGWNFILWGVVLFIIIAIEKAGLKRFLDRVKIAGHIYMIFLIPLTWMIFAITDMGALGIYAGRLIGLNIGGGTVFEGDFSKYLDMYGILMAVCAVLSVSGPAKLFEKISGNVLGAVILFAIFWGSVYLLYIGLNDPFLYFRF